MKVKIILYSILLFQFLSAQAQNEFVDITFGTNSGYTLSPTSEIDLFLRDVIEVNEKLYAVSTDYISNTFLLRYNLNGTLDSSFGSNGIITIPLIEVGGEVGDRFNQLMSTSDNKLLMINSTYPSSYEDSYISQVIKVNLDGTLDVNYGTNGRYLNSLEYGLAVIGAKKSPVDDLIIVEVSRSWAKTLIVDRQIIVNNILFIIIIFNDKLTRMLWYNFKVKLYRNITSILIAFTII